jgi:hypothetical protein
VAIISHPVCSVKGFANGQAGGEVYSPPRVGEGLGEGSASLVQTGESLQEPETCYTMLSNTHVCAAVPARQAGQAVVGGDGKSQ